MPRYEKYKDSGIEWIGDIPEYWEVKKLKYKINFITGYTPPSGKLEYYTNGNNIWVTIADMKDKFIGDSMQKITNDAIDDLDLIILPIGSLLYSFKLSVGKVAFNEKKLYTNEAIFSIPPNKKTNLNFYYYSLPQQVAKNANENIYGAKILNQNLIKNANLIIPPINEQTTIANYLDNKTAKIEQIIKQKEQLLVLYEEEKTAIINQAVTKGINPDVNFKDSGIDWMGNIPEHWEVMKLRFLSKIKTGEKDTENREYNGKYPFYVRSQTVERISSYSFDGEAILTAGDGVGVGKVFHYVNGKFECHQRVYRISDFNNIKAKYLFYYMRYNFYKEVIRISAKSTVDSLRLPMLQNFPVCYSLNKQEQTTIVTHIETQTTKIDSKIVKTSKLITLLQEYKTALISEVVTGKLKVF